jgi:hypothetical protein
MHVESLKIGDSLIVKGATVTLLGFRRGRANLRIEDAGELSRKKRDRAYRPPRDGEIPLANNRRQA